MAHFWPIFPIFGAKNFLRKIRLCHAQLHMGFCQNLEKTKDIIPTKQILFYRTLPATTGVPIKPHDHTERRSNTCMMQTASM